MTFDELVASLRQIDGQRDKGKHPPNFHFRSMPFLHFHNGPDRAYADVRFGGDFEPVTAYPARRMLICIAGGPASSGVLGACVEQSDDPEEPVEALAMAGGRPYEELHASSWPAAVSLRCAGRRLTRSSSTNPD